MCLYHSTYLTPWKTSGKRLCKIFATQLQSFQKSPKSGPWNAKRGPPWVIYLLEEGRCFARQILVLSQNKILINHFLDHRPPQPPLLAGAVCFNFHSSLIPRVLQNFAQSLSGIIYISITLWNFKLWLFAKNYQGSQPPVSIFIITKSDSWAVELQFHNPMMSLMTFHKWRVADSILHAHPLLKLPVIECIC